MIKNIFIGATKHIHNLYNTTLPNIKNAFKESSSFLKVIIYHISSGDNKFGLEDTWDELPTPNDSKKHQKHTP
ncbi:hypothetical protein YYC_04765 [Plasmodium yoelii 17X]|uniref:Uncharacterized protein n=2 Tax=Plasmodium yoelii TaxID=5861 RepID=Q7RIG4_PLAYO|nr:hypothetical protein [Plasmodium yoelii yoelii]ETB57989.1 hypothetical protein YYC_04765 [Plasmodium yoelii 17X]